MKKILLILFLFLLSLSLASCGNNSSSSTNINSETSKMESSSSENSTSESSSTESSSSNLNLPTTLAEVENLVIHYYRFDDKQSEYTIWLWQKSPAAGSGQEFSFIKDTNDEFGYSITVPYSGFIENATEVGIIVKKGPGWDGARDVDGDRFFSLTDECVNNGVANMYIVQGTEKISNTYSGIDISAKILSASFTSSRQISINATEIADSYIVKKDNEVIAEDNLTNTSNSFIISLDKDVDLNSTYTVVCKFKSLEKSIEVTFDSLYDSKEFNDTFAYSGDLGAIYSKESTTFKVWAPTRKKIELVTYTTGTPAKDYQGNLIAGGTDTRSGKYEMVKGDKGVFSYTLAGDQNGTYYNFVVVVNDKETEIVDPYAKTTGVNGLRGMVLDFSTTNPSDWTETLPHGARTINDAIVYELHVRDLTSHSSWNGSEENRSKYLGLIEEGTTYTEGDTTVTTGFDHIKELGVTDVQILPFFDFGVIDETRVNEPGYESKSFNWGYMPENYNSLEGSYSSNPYDGSVRVEEMKKVVNAYNKAGIGVIMDVVFNHTGKSADSNLNVLVPSYYYRTTESGAFSNGSGTGNETASDRTMMQKFMIDSCKFYASEYNLSGFRFDLMGLHDIDTMNKINTECKAIDPSIIVYGEPWTGGTSPLDTNIAATKENIDDLNGVGAFNDELRDAVKGSVWSASEGGWVQGESSSSIVNQIFDGVTGRNSQFSGSDQVVNYVSAHDNNTLYDKLLATGVSASDRANVQVQANSFVLTSQGLAFLHAGVEICRTKKNADGTTNENSYESPDSVNQIDWSRKITYLNVFNSYKKMIEIRKDHVAFRKDSLDDINQNITLLASDTNVIAYEIKDSNDSWNDIIVVNCNHNYSTVNLPEGNWSVLNVQTNIEYTISNTLTVIGNYTYILHKVV